MKRIRKEQVIYFLLFIILTIGTMLLNFGYLPIGLLILISLSFYSIIYFIKNRRLKNRKAKIHLNIWKITLVVLFIVFTLSRLGKNITERRAEILITAIEKYKSEKETYPLQLEDVVSEKILNDLPKPIFYYAKGFNYYPIRCDSAIGINTFCNYKISYYGQLETEATYDGKNRIWNFDD